MYSYIEDELKSLDVNIKFGSNVEKIILDEKKLIMDDGTVHTYDCLLSSIPLSVFCKLSNTQLPLRLKFKPLYSLFYELDSEPIPDCHVLFNFTQRGFWKRITFHSSYYGVSNNKSYFVLESMPDDIHLNDPNIVDILDQDFRRTFDDTAYTKQMRNASLIGSKMIPNAYPIYTKDFDPSVIDAIKQDLALHSAYIVGRQGEFDYVSSSDVANSSIKAIDKILSDTRKVYEVAQV
jgi:protoporphyrinogen oxidase